jgi:poly-gamma-glutamate capsule biosynthesis protein CapA/YwtB (metallophosphatase superfamily)
VSAATAITVVLSGDALIARPYRADTASRRGFVELIRGANAAFTNLEILLNDFRGPPAPDIGIHLSTSPRSGRELMSVGFNLFAVANNHALDYGVEGLRRHVEALRRLGACFAGAGETAADAARPAYLETGRGRGALVACASSLGAGWPAADACPGLDGRPGLNPLRFGTRYLAEDQLFAELRAIALRLGFEPRERHEVEMGYVLPLADPENQLRLFGGIVERASETRVETVPEPGDLDTVLTAVREAVAQADVVVVSLHTQEWKGSDEEPADFARAFAHACVDAGAHVVTMSGPHVLRGVEVYRGAPIFYSLGNLWFEYELVERLPADSLVRYGLAAAASPEEFADVAMVGFRRDARFWQSVVPRCVFVGGELGELTLHPISLGFGEPRGLRGTPELASAHEAPEILSRLQELSRPYGTEMDVVDAVGRVV